MKKLLFVAAFAFAAQFAQAQETLPALQKGKWLVETNLSPFSLTKTTGLSYMSNDGNSEWAVGGEAGYFAADKLAIKLGLGIYGQKYEGLDSETALSYKIGAKYYISNILPIQVDFGGINSDGDNATILGAQIGYAWFVRDNISIEPGVRYDHGLNDIASDIKTFSARIGFSLHF